MRLARGDLRGLDLSHLAIRQAYLPEVDAQDTSLVGADLAETALAEAFHFPLSVALSRDGAFLAAGTSTGEVWLWRVADRTPIWVVPGHTGGVWGVALSEDGLLVSGGEDGRVRLWETGTGRALETLPSHPGGVHGVALSPDGPIARLQWCGWGGAGLGDRHGPGGSGAAGARRRRLARGAVHRR